MRSRCLHPGQQQGRRWPSLSSSWVRRMRRSRVISCLASSTQQMNSLRARGVMSIQASSAVGLAISALRRSVGSLCTTPPATRELLTGPRYRATEPQHHPSRPDRKITDLLRVVYNGWCCPSATRVNKTVAGDALFVLNSADPTHSGQRPPRAIAGSLPGPAEQQYRARHVRHKARKVIRARRVSRSRRVRRCTGERSRPPRCGCACSTESLRVDGPAILDRRIPGLVGPTRTDKLYRVQPLGAGRSSRIDQIPPGQTSVQCDLERRGGEASLEHCSGQAADPGGYVADGIPELFDHPVARRFLGRSSDFPFRCFVPSLHPRRWL